MKKIEAYIRPEKLDSVVNALEQAGYSGLSITEVRGHGKQRGESGQWHGQYQPHTFQQKLRLDLIVRDSDLNRLVQALMESARTQQYGDGKIFISEVADAVRIRTGQRGEVALD